MDLPEDVLSVGMEELAAAIERETAKGARRVVLIAPGRIEALVAEAEARGAAGERERVRRELLARLDASPAGPPHLYRGDVDEICPGPLLSGACIWCGKPWEKHVKPCLGPRLSESL